MYVSIHLMLLFIGDPGEKGVDGTGFNTSHVTLYPGQNQDQFRR